MISLVENNITIEEYLYLRSRVSWRALSREQADKAIENSLFFVKAVDDEGNILGMGRIVGDGAVICYIQDLIVVPEAQGNSIGRKIIERLIEYVKGISVEDTTMMLCLMCAKGREPFYEKFGFVARPNNVLGPGMIQYIMS